MDYRQIVSQLVGDLVRDYQLTPEQASGVAGSFAHETGGFKFMQELKPSVGQGGYGFAQWTGSRRDDFEKWSKDHDLSPTSYAANLGYFEHELETSPFERSRFDLVRRAQTAEEAARIFTDKSLRPQEGKENYPERARYANQIMGEIVPSLDLTPADRVDASPSDSISLATGARDQELYRALNPSLPVPRPSHVSIPALPRPRPTRPGGNEAIDAVDRVVPRPPMPSAFGYSPETISDRARGQSGDRPAAPSLTPIRQMLPSIAPPSRVAPKPETASVDMRLMRATTPPSGVGKPPATRTVASVPFPALTDTTQRLNGGVYIGNMQNRPVSPAKPVPQTFAGQERVTAAPPTIRTASLAGSPRPVAPLVGPSNLQEARAEQAAMRNSSRPASPVAQASIPSASGTLVAGKTQDRLAPGQLNNGLDLYGTVNYAQAGVPGVPRASTGRPVAPVVPGVAPVRVAAVAPVPAIRSTGVGSELDVTRPVMPAVPVVPMPRLDRPGFFGTPQILGHGINLPGVFGLVQSLTKTMNNASGPFNNGGDNALYNLFRGGDFNTPGAATMTAGGYLFAPPTKPGGRPINVGRADSKVSAATLYDRRNASNNRPDLSERISRQGSGGGGAQSLSSLSR